MKIADNDAVFTVSLFVSMIGICLLVLFVIPLLYRVIKHSLQSVFKQHKRLPEESDLVSVSTDSEKQKLPIDFTDPTDSDGYFD